MSILKVTAYISTPIVMRNEVHLDGLLMWAATQGRDDSTQLQRGISLKDMSEVSIPVQKVTAQGHSIYAATGSQLHNPTRYEHRWTRRRDAGDINRLAKRYVPGFGPGRDLNRRAPGASTSHVQWLVSSTDDHQVGRLLNLVTALGSLRSHGCGEISMWEIEEADLSLTDCFVQSGRAMRSLPVDWVVEASTVRRLACAPPYWHPENHIVSVPMGAECSLLQKVINQFEVNNACFST